jgi:hypothetical protein
MKIRFIFASIILPFLAVSLWADWGACNIGAVGGDGVQLQADTTDTSDDTTSTLAFTLSAAGAPLVDKTDALGFASGPAKLKGDCEIVAQLVKISPGTPDWAAGGVMIRENFGAGSKFFSVACTRGHGIQSFVRDQDSVLVTTQENCTNCNPPSWLKIVRKGNHFSSYKSMDGKIWLEVNETDVPMKKAVWVGVFTTSGGGPPAVDVTFTRVAASETGSH